MEFPELGIYTLPGHTDNPAEMLDEVRAAEALGLGSVWISERYDVKEAATLSGAAAAITSEIFIGTGATNHFTRHPQVTAAFGSTMSRLSGGRFALGLARGVGVRNAMLGLQNATNAELADFVGILRRLWRGERVVGHKGPAGEFPYLYGADWLDEQIPLLLCAFGRRSLEFAGGVFDGVILHTFMSDEAVARAVGLVRRGAEKAGRDPASVKVWTVLATACDVPEEKALKYLVARMGTYLQAPGYGELLIDINEWDPAVLERFRGAPVVSGTLGAIDSVATLDQLREIRELIPEAWLPAAAGDAEQCAQRFVDQFAAGADGVVIHASKPEEVAPVLAAYAGLRPAERFAGRTRRPGG
jgi:probable F420-dependent oxidoreductase